MRISDLLSGKKYFYILHLSFGKNQRREELWDFARKKSIIGLDNREILEDWPRAKKAGEYTLSGIWIRQFDMFCENSRSISMDKGDLVIVMAGQDYVLGIGRVIGPHRYDITYRDRDQFFDHVRPIEWILEYDFEDRQKIPRVHGFSNTLARVKSGQKRWDLFSNLDFRDMKAKVVQQQPKNDAQNLKHLADIQTKLTKEPAVISRFKRSRELTRRLKQLYRYQCQLCTPESTEIPQIPTQNGYNYVEIHHIKGFNEVTNIEGVDQESGDYIIDNYKNAIIVCVYHHKLLHKHKNAYSYDVPHCRFVSKDGSSEIPVVLNKHL